ncbi:hypothetical protein K7X08_018486 [Anisodus acutangulus]|uniref:Protein kinase domain-containing protein n=1 Tax=Anisodus acutangulus TaxID=402998 RepID=A0A9Q1LVS8_9SOLA|nr:hypothetical protein K7X08_018486 [Anisodus acutangulus]
MRHKDSSSGHFDMQLIGTFLSFASRGDRVGLNQMLRQGISPNVQDYDKRTALHLAASEGHASIVELLLAYKADVNLKDRWRRTPLTDAKLYGHRDICRILEVCGGKDSNSDQPLTVRHEGDSIEENIDISELNMQHSSMIEQGLFGESEMVKWRGTWVVKTAIKRVFSAKSICQKGMNYLHRHKPLPIVHNNLHPKNLLLHEGGHLKIGEYWVQILDNQIYANQDCCQLNNGCNLISHLCHDISKDICSFGLIFYQMLEGRQVTNTSSELMHVKSVDLEKKLYIGRYPSRILQLIEDCTSTVPSTRPSFATVIEILEEVSLLSGKTGQGGNKQSRGVKVIYPSGEISHFYQPIKAAELMLETPNFFLVNTRSLHIGRRFSALNADEDLEMGNVYAMFPMKRLNSFVSAGDMGALLLTANSVSKRVSIGSFRILPECAVEIKESQSNYYEQVSALPKLNFDDIEKFSSEEFKHRLSMRRSKKPLLETIAEEPVCSR